MKILTRIVILVVVLVSLSKISSSQMSVSFYSSSLSKIGFGYKFSEQVWSEVRVHSNTRFEDITPEVVVNYNFIRKEQYNAYAGGGLSLNFIQGAVVPIGLQFSPFEKMNNFALHIEIVPTFEFEDDPLLQSSWGVRYTF